jgi:RNA polymerase sigma factor, sigma-70 family
MKIREMTDQEIIEGLISRDNRITQQFFFVKCRPLFSAIIRLVFNYPLEYDEMVNILYAYLMADDCAKLRQFQYRSTIYQWMKVVATRFFIRHRNQMIEDSSKSDLYPYTDYEEEVDYAGRVADRIDTERLLEMMTNKRYSNAIRRLVLNDEAPEKYAAELGVSVDNLYNIKKRAMTAFEQIAIKHYSYGK